MSWICILFSQYLACSACVLSNKLFLLNDFETFPSLVCCLLVSP